MESTDRAGIEFLEDGRDVGGFVRGRDSGNQRDDGKVNLKGHFFSNIHICVYLTVYIYIYTYV